MNALTTVDFNLQEEERIVGQLNTLKSQRAKGEGDVLNLRDLQENMEGLEKAAGSFESFFYQMMMREMKSTLNRDDGILPPSNAQKMYEELLDEEVAKNMGQERSLGMARMVVEAYKSHVVPAGNRR